MSRELLFFSAEPTTISAIWSDRLVDVRKEP